MSFVRSFSCQQLQKWSWGRRNALMRKKIQTKNIRQVGSQTFPVIYCSIYILRIVSKWEDEKEKREEMTARRDEAGHIQMEGLNVCTCCQFTCSSVMEGHGAWKRAEFPRPFWKCYIHLGCFCCAWNHVHHHHLLTLSYFCFFICLNHLFLPSMNYYCILISVFHVM